MRLNPAHFNAFLNNVGQHVAWQQAFACPCVNPNSGAALPSCPVCAGKGRTWNPPVPAVVALSGQKVQREWAQFGVYESGDVVVSIPSDSPVYAISAFDRVVFQDSSTPFSLVLKRGDQDLLRFPVVSISRVFWLDASNNVVDGGIPTVSADGALAWSSGEPPAGRQYSVSGRQQPEYYVYGDYAQDRRHFQGADLPRRIVLRRFDLFGR